MNVEEQREIKEAGPGARGPNTRWLRNIGPINNVIVFCH